MVRAVEVWVTRIEAGEKEGGITITITIRKHPSHNREEPGISSTCNRGPARRSHDRRGYNLLGLSAGMFDHTPWHPHLP